MRKATLLLLSLFLVVAFTGISEARYNACTVNYTVATHHLGGTFFAPTIVILPYGFWYGWNDGYYPPVPEETTGWHTTCIGASWVDKNPKPPVKVALVPPPPPVKKKVVPPPPPIVVVPTPKPKPPVVLNPIYFDPIKSNITPISAKVLDNNGVMLKSNPEIKVEIVGHTDNKGSEAANIVLSEKRANSAKYYLADKFKISEDRMKAKGLGSTKPIADNSTEEGRKQNRRVEFIIIK